MKAPSPAERSLPPRLPAPAGPAAATTRPEGRGTQLRRWISQGAWAISDQALFALSNLLVNVMLARWLPPGEYGAFVTAYTLLLLLGVAHGALLIEPMMMFGASRYADVFPQYLRVLLRFHWIVSAGAAAALGLAALVFQMLGLEPMVRALTGVACAVPFILLSWLVRRACYTVGRPGISTLGGVVYLVIMAGGAAGLYWSGRMSVILASLLMAVAALAASGVMLRTLGPRPSGRPVDRASVWAAHWDFAQWGAAAGLLLWTQGYAFYLLLPVWGGLEATATLRALMNVVMPILQSDSALVALLVPAFARAQARGTLFTLVRWSAALFALEALTYWGVLAAFHGPIVTLLYGENYRQQSELLLILGALPLVSSLYNIFGAALRVRGQIDRVFWATLGSVLVTATVGLAAMWIAGIAGGVLGLVLASLTQMLLVARWYLKSDAARAGTRSVREGDLAQAPLY